MSFIDFVSPLVGDTLAPYALFSSTSRSVGGIIFDVTVREVHVDEDRITVNPVQSGSPVSDHVFAEPKLIEIQAGASDSTGGYDGYVQDVYQSMLALKATREPFDVSTGKRYYPSMLFANITVVTDEASEYALMVTARLQEVIITDTSDVDGGGLTQANQADPASTAPSSNAGTQSLQSAPSASLYSDYESGFGPSPGSSGSNI